MKKIIIFLLTTTAILGLNTACEERSPVEITEVESVFYSSTHKEFTVHYTNGYAENVIAIIDNSTTPPSAYAILENGTYLYVNDASITTDNVDISTSAQININAYVNDWIYNEMSIYYYWNDKLPRKVNSDLKPDKFFNSILYKYSASQPDGDRFSWIQNDYKELQNSLSGVASDEIGFEYGFVPVNENDQYYALVTYTKEGTSAQTAGIKRGQFITKVDDKKITANNYRELFTGTGTKKLSRAEWIYDFDINKYVITVMTDARITMHKDFAENPVYKDSVYTVGDKKIGYLVYNFFATDKGDNSNKYDRLLMNKLQSIKDKGATEMILDLRYNRGGAVSSAIALSSALVKDRDTKNILVTSEYNSIVHNALKGEYGADYNKEYFIDKIASKGGNINIPSLGTDRLFILTGENTASASEFVINGLKPYMDVVLIGKKTYGKNVGSITIYEDKDPKNKWGMQPIIVKYMNSLGKSDFTDGFIPNHEVDEFEELHLVPFGDTQDPILAKAISVISGKEPTTTKATTSFRSSQIDKRKNASLRPPLKFEMVDDINGDAIRELFKK